MLARRRTPILNVSDMQQSFTWFEKLGWQKGWEWGTPPHFGGVCSSDCEIFLAVDHGVWMSMPWSVREMHARHPDGHVFRISRVIDDATE